MTAASNQTILGLTPGEIIEGRFQIGELIGYGGQGAVLSVNHLEWDRRLALKLPLPDAVNSARKSERFVREAEAWIRLGATTTHSSRRPQPTPRPGLERLLRFQGRTAPPDPGGRRRFTRSQLRQDTAWRA